MGRIFILRKTIDLIATKGDVEAEYAEFIAQWEEEGGLEFEEEATEIMK